MHFTPIVLAFAYLLLAAAAVDFARQRIPNWIVLAVVALFLVQAARHAGEVAWVNQVGASAALLLAGLGLFSLGELGAGDAKMIAGVSLWAGFLAILKTLLLIGVAGLLFAGLLLLARRMLPWPSWDPHDRRPKALIEGGGVPYGVAIAAGALISLGYFPTWLWS